MGQFDVNFHLRKIIKGHALAEFIVGDFITEFTYASTTDVIGMADDAKAVKAVETRGKDDSTPTQKETQQWTLYVDGASNENGYGVGMMLISPKGHKIHYALHFKF